jgi:flagellar basal body-associated protein FliL
MANIRLLIGQLLALGIVVAVVANAQFGMLSPKIIEGAPKEKYEFSAMTEPDCAPLFDRLEELVADGTDTNCFRPAGEWSGMDFVLLGPFLFILLSGRIKFARVGTKKDRTYKGAFVIGVFFFSMAVMDRLGIIPTQVDSNGISDLLPIAISPLYVQIIVALVGCLLMMGPKYWEAEAIAKTNEKITKRRDIANEFRTKFGSVATPLQLRSGTNKRINRSKILQKDSRLHMMKKPGKGLKVYATCPFCSGGGCSRCGNDGTL